MSPNSKILWPSSLKAIREMCYESIAPLYEEIIPDKSSSQIGLILSCSKFFTDPNGCPGCIHKLEVDASPTFAEAKMQITHEVLPNRGASSQIIDVNNKLKVVCFDKGYIVPVKNFGYKKTFNSDVRAGLQHHCAPIYCIASDSAGKQLASGSTDGEVALYQVREEEITFLSRTKVTNYVTGLAYIKPSPVICSRPKDKQVCGGENMLVYCTLNGHIGLIDARCDLGSQLSFSRVMTTEPRLNLSALCLASQSSGPTVHFGSCHGQVISVDLRCNKRYLFEQNLSEDLCIRRMKEIFITDSDGRNKTYLAYTNGTNELKILDAATMKPQEGWTCDRSPEAAIKDLCQIGNRIITCGDKTTIGCWQWDASTENT